MGDWLVDAVIPTEMKISEEDDEYGWGHPVGDVKWIKWSKVQKNHQGWKYRGYHGPGVAEAIFVDGSQGKYNMKREVERAEPWVSPTFKRPIDREQSRKRQK